MSSLPGRAESDVKPHGPGKEPPRQSLRMRLAVWNAAVVILTAVTTLVILRQGVTWALYHEINEMLKEDVEEISLMLKDTPAGKFDQLKEELDRKAQGHHAHGWFVELRAEDNSRLLWAAGGPESSRIEKSLPEDSDSEKRTDPQKAPPNEHNVDSIIVGTQLTSVRHDLTRIDELVVLSASLIFAIAPVFAYWLAGRATQAVGEITRTASRLRPEHLDERLPIRGTGDELDQLASTINGLLDRIAVFLDQKRDILANAAHELRTPLAAIRSSVEVTLNGDRSVVEYQELLEDIMDQSGSLQGLLNQLLLLSETEAERLKTQIEVVELDRVVARSVAMFEGVAEARETTLVVSRLDAVRVAGNKTHLQQVANNLIDNALKYTPASGRVDVSLIQSPDKGFATFTVRDNGIGIAPDDQRQIFDRFFRVDRSRSRGDTPGGSGLGLSICKAVIEAHGGRIRCESRPGIGSDFIVELPLAGSISVKDAEHPAIAMTP